MKRKEKAHSEARKGNECGAEYGVRWIVFADPTSVKAGKRVQEPASLYGESEDVDK